MSKPKLPGLSSSPSPATESPRPEATVAEIPPRPAQAPATLPVKPKAAATVATIEPIEPNLDPPPKPARFEPTAPFANDLLHSLERVPGRSKVEEINSSVERRLEAVDADFREHVVRTETRLVGLGTNARGVIEPVYRDDRGTAEHRQARAALEAERLTFDAQARRAWLLEVVPAIAHLQAEVLKLTAEASPLRRARRLGNLSSAEAERLRRLEGYRSRADHAIRSLGAASGELPGLVPKGVSEWAGGARALAAALATVDVSTLGLADRRAVTALKARVTATRDKLDAALTTASWAELVHMVERRDDD